MSIAMTEWMRKLRPETLASRSIKRKMKAYGLSRKEYDRLLTESGGRCRICKVRSNDLVVDHDHDTNEIRGLLCRLCNIGIGYFKVKDDPRRLRAAADFLEQHRR